MRNSNTSLRSFILKLVVLIIVDAFAIQLAITLGTHIGAYLGIGVVIFTIAVNIVFLDERLYPWRWISPALAGMALLVVYPMGYSLSIAFTNRGEGHLLSKQQVVDR